MIQTFEGYFGPEVTLADHAERFPNSVLDRTGPAEGVSGAATAEAYVSGGVWVARCPQADCRGVEIVRDSDGLFFCCNCRNAGFGRKPIKTKMPPPKQRTAIEQALELRPVPQTRNWDPSMSVEDLRRENDEHGIEG